MRGLLRARLGLLRQRERLRLARLRLELALVLVQPVSQERRKLALVRQAVWVFLLPQRPVHRRAYSRLP